MSLTGPSVVLIGTLDTKSREVGFLAAAIHENLRSHAASSGIHVSVADVSIRALVESREAAGWEAPQGVTVISGEDILRASGHEATVLRGKSKGEAIDFLAGALKAFLLSTSAPGQLAGAIGLGGSCGSSLAAPALAALPLGLPKMLLSTVASVSAAALVGTSDLMLVPSVADISGLNAVLRPSLSNSAAALAAMAQQYAATALAPAPLAARAHPGHARPTVGITMFGVTTPCVTEVQRQLDARGFESVVFHATGLGGRAMEELLDAGTLQGVIDVTTTEVADLVVGGVLACDDTRFDAAIRKGLPLLLSVGALDMVNFGAPSSVPERFQGRTLYQHNPQVTLMRTTSEESKAIAEFIAHKVNRSSAPVQVLFPEKGVSALDKEGQPFFAPQADLALLHELQGLIHSPPQKQVISLPLHINDPEFATALVEVFCNLYADLLKPEPTQAEAGAVDSSGQASGAEAGSVQLGREPSSALLTPEQTRVHGIRQRIQTQLALLRADRPVEIAGLAERRRNILEKLRAQISAGRALIGGGAGTGISAKCEEAGGVDLIVIYNSGRFRMAGRGSLAGLLPFKDANAVVVEMASEVLPVVKAVPVLAGVCATDPFRIIPRFLRELAALGFAGVQNFPTVGLMDGVFRQNLEETGMGFGLEVEMVAVASVMGFLTTPYAFNEEEARDMAAAGADVVVAHMGLTTAGSIGALTALSLDQSVARVQAIADAARSIKENVIVLCHGGPISGPAEAEYILQRTKGVHGFYGASSMERLPVEIAMVENLKKYKDIKLH